MNEKDIRDKKEAELGYSGDRQERWAEQQQKVLEPRKIIQIAIEPRIYKDINTDDIDSQDSNIYALCNDGTILRVCDDGNDTWSEIDFGVIPQPEKSQTLSY